MSCAHMRCAVRVRRRSVAGHPVLVGLQCVDCLRAIIHDGVYWLPRAKWPADADDWVEADELPNSQVRLFG